MSQSRGLPLIGVVGGIGSGKSSVSRALAERRPVAIIDADRIGHELLSDSSVKQQLTKQFGPTILAEDGSVRRSALAAMVFGEARDRAAGLAALNSILHPLIKQEIQRQIEQAESDGRAEAVILDAALLQEAGWADACHAVVFVDVPVEQRQRRVTETRGWTPEEFESREAAQFAIDNKRSLADYTIDNSSTLEHAGQAFEDILNTILSQQPH